MPEDVLIVGFDNSAESRIIEPHLTTVHIPSPEMGFLAADLLLSRIERPETPYRIMHVRTAVKYRDSTGSLTPEEEAKAPPPLSYHRNASSSQHSWSSLRSGRC